MPEERFGDRLKRFLARYEPFATRLLLLGIFVTGLIAQFVKPMGDALQGKPFLGGALLSLVAYVLYDTVKDLAAALRSPTHMQVKSRELGSFVTEAFEERSAEISFLGYTGETLYNALYHRLECFFDDPGPTRKVSIRFLVPDFRQPMSVPSRVEEHGVPEDDEEFRKRLESECQEYDRSLSAIAQRLTMLGRVTAECEYRFYQGIPRDKVTARTMGFSSEPEYYDPKGYQTDLNVWSRKDDEDSKVAVATWKQHFDDLRSLADIPPWHRGAPV
ncbi:hypothetical protein ACWDCC_27970 [Streptomyces sp. NPDC001102]